MRVLVGPHADPASDGIRVAMAELLAGPDGAVVLLRDVGVKNFSRRLSAAEVALLRTAMSGGDPERHPEGGKRRDNLVGYVCWGAGVGISALPPNGPALVAVTDHADLTWRSPLTGPNDDRLGPRFPTMDGVYAPEVVRSCVGPGERMTVIQGVVAGVLDVGSPSAYEEEMANAQGCVAVSSELAPVAIVAAHMGLRVAAVVVIGLDGKEIHGGRS
jgi:hypothetical protein